MQYPKAARTHYLDEMTPDALDDLEREVTDRLAESRKLRREAADRLAQLRELRQRLRLGTKPLRKAEAELAEFESELATTKIQLDQIKLARTEQERRASEGVVTLNPP